MKDALSVLHSRLPTPPIWAAYRRVGSFIYFNMGERVEVTSPQRPSHYVGKLILVVHLCHWKLFDDDKEVLNSYCEDDNIYETVFSNLIEQQITKIKKVNTTTIRISFSKNWHVVLEADLDFYEKENELFYCYKTQENEDTISYSVERGFYFNIEDN